jgi:hypothetical protein
LITPAKKLKGILPVIISGGRPELKLRPTAVLLSALSGITAPPVWVVSSTDAPGYESDGHEISVYERDWAEDYAATHWMGMKPLVKGTGEFLGAFAGREWACRLAEERGCWAVLQLDDNLVDLSLFRRHYTACSRIAEDEGGLGMYADVLGAITLSTNGWMTGAFLTAVPPSNEKLVVSRTGFPYSLFLERVGEGREEWYGPYEDDITHAYQYGNNPDNATALLVPMLGYMKEHASKTGMRKNYNSTRAVPLQRIFPETARVGIYHGKANGRGDPRVFHKMLPGAIRTPMVVTDKVMYGKVAAYLSKLAKRFARDYRQAVEIRAEDRARKVRVARAVAGEVGVAEEDAIPASPMAPVEPISFLSASGDGLEPGTAAYWETPTWMPDRT